jgi:hypothetical protein
MPVLVLMRASTVTWCSLWFSTFTCRQGGGGGQHNRHTWCYCIIHYVTL